MSERVPGKLNIERANDGFIWVWQSQNRSETVRSSDTYANHKDAKNAGLKFAKRSKRR